MPPDSTTNDGVDTSATGETDSGAEVVAETATQEEVSEAIKSTGIEIPESAKLPEEKIEDDKGADVSEAGESDESDAGDVADTDTSDKAEVDVIEEEKPTGTDQSPDTPDFTLQVEDAQGVTHKIEKIEDLPEDFEPKNNRQIIEILAGLQKAEGEKAKYEADQAEATQKAENDKAIQDTLTGWQNEFKELNVVDDDRKQEVMDYMAKENDKRQAEGKPLIRTVEHALLSIEKQEAKETEATKAKEAKENARKNGGLVGGSSAPASNAPPVYKAGSATNGAEAARAMGLL